MEQQIAVVGVGMWKMGKHLLNDLSDEIKKVAKFFYPEDSFDLNLLDKFNLVIFYGSLNPYHSSEHLLYLASSCNAQSKCSMLIEPMVDLTTEELERFNLLLNLFQKTCPTITINDIKCKQNKLNAEDILVHTIHSIVSLTSTPSSVNLDLPGFISILDQANKGTIVYGTTSKSISQVGFRLLGNITKQNIAGVALLVEGDESIKLDFISNLGEQFIKEFDPKGEIIWGFKTCSKLSKVYTDNSKILDDVLGVTAILMEGDLDFPKHKKIETNKAENE